jgi:hypothetical protein
MLGVRWFSARRFAGPFVAVWSTVALRIESWIGSGGTLLPAGQIWYIVVHLWFSEEINGALPASKTPHPERMRHESRVNW